MGGYFAWLFWGTGLATQSAQRHLRAQVSERIAHPVPVPSSGGSQPISVSLKDGDPMAILRIPKIHLDMVVVEGTSVEDLKKGPGHYPATPSPWDAHGRVAIAGHRTTYLHPFWSLDKLQKGDLIELRTQFGTFDYRVTSVAEVAPSAQWVLEQTKNPTLILSTCTPRFFASKRLVVFASR